MWNLLVFAVIGLLTGALWSFPAAMAALALLMVYQLYRYTHTHSLALILLTLFDAVVWWLVWQEYRVLRFGALRERRSSLRTRLVTIDTPSSSTRRTCPLRLDAETSKRSNGHMPI